MICLHASCAARDGAGILLVGPSGSGKSDLLLRLIDRGFALVADDRVEVDGMRASPPAALAGLLEVRGLGILRMEFMPSAILALTVRLGAAERLPAPARYDRIGLPMISVDPRAPSAPLLVAMALDAVQGGTNFVTGAFG